MNTSSLFLQFVARRAAQMATVSAVAGVALQIVGCAGSVTTGAHDGTGGSGDSSVTSSKAVGPGGGGPINTTTTVTTGPEDETVTSTSTGWSTSSGSFLQALCMPWPIANTDVTTNDATVGTTGDYYPTTGTYQNGVGGSYGYAVVAAGTTVGTGAGGVGGAAETTAVTVGGSGGWAGDVGTSSTITTVVGVGGAGGWLPGTSSTSITTDTAGIGGGFGSSSENVGITVGGGTWTCPDAAYALQYLSSACGVLAVQDPGTYDAGRCCYVATVASCTTD